MESSFSPFVFVPPRKEASLKTASLKRARAPKPLFLSFLTIFFWSQNVPYLEERFYMIFFGVKILLPFRGDYISKPFLPYFI